MERNTKRFRELFGKYLSNTTSNAEEQEFFAYVEDPLYQDRIKDLLSESFAKQTAFIHLKAHSRIRILNHIFQKEQEGKGRSRYRRMASRIAVAASILLCIGAVFYVFRWNMPS